VLLFSIYLKLLSAYLRSSEPENVLRRRSCNYLLIKPLENVSQIGVLRAAYLEVFIAPGKYFLARLE
jgi:hypothetical protein